MFFFFVTQYYISLSQTNTTVFLWQWTKPWATWRNTLVFGAIFVVLLSQRQPTVNQQSTCWLTLTVSLIYQTQRTVWDFFSVTNTFNWDQEMILFPLYVSAVASSYCTLKHLKLKLPSVNSRNSNNCSYFLASAIKDTTHSLVEYCMCRPLFLAVLTTVYSKNLFCFFLARKVKFICVIKWAEH